MTHLGLKLFFFILILLSWFLGGLCECPESLQYGQEVLLLLCELEMGVLDNATVFLTDILRHALPEGSRSRVFKTRSGEKVA